MAVVIWVFAGGGEAEVRGLLPFLERNFSGCRFERRTPVRMKPGPRPGVSYGHTGPGLARQIAFQLSHVSNRPPACQALLVLDDLDCHDPATRRTLFDGILDACPAVAGIPRIIGFAAPELEAWLIADWDRTFAQDLDFRQHHGQMRWWLSAQKGVPFDSPESFGTFDPAKDACDEKLSDWIIESSQQSEGMVRFSKATHTPRMLQLLDIQVVEGKCPLFRAMTTSLRALISTRPTRQLPSRHI